MITNIETNYTNLVAFEFTGEITKEDFENTVFPAIKSFKDTHDEINMVYILNTELKEFTANAWVQDALLGIKNIAKFKHVAIVTDNETVQQFTELFSKLIPGDFKGFDKIEKDKALAWAAQG